MIKVDFPEPVFRLKKEGKKEFIFDAIRKVWIMLTEEEWVRQNFVQYLIQVIRYPATLIAIEKEIMLGELKKRFDILVYDRDHHPWMLVECKAGDIALREHVLDQVLRYNISVPVQYLLITNGKCTYGWEKHEFQIKEIDAMPVLL